MVIAGTAAIALVACSGGKNGSSSTTASNASPAAAPSMAAATGSTMASGAMKTSTTGAAGAKIFTTNCASCHQANGKGEPGAFPPLAGNALVTGQAAKVIHIVKDGLNGKIIVGGKTYNAQMPAWKGTLSDSDIASVITYIRSTWGNKAGAVTVSQVTATK